MSIPKRSPLLASSLRSVYAQRRTIALVGWWLLLLAFPLHAAQLPDENKAEDAASNNRLLVHVWENTLSSNKTVQLTKEEMMLIEMSAYCAADGELPAQLLANMRQEISRSSTIQGNHKTQVLVALAGAVAATWDHGYDSSQAWGLMAALHPHVQALWREVAHEDNPAYRCLLPCVNDLGSYLGQVGGHHEDVIRLLESAVRQAKVWHAAATVQITTYISLAEVHLLQGATDRCLALLTEALGVSARLDPSHTIWGKLHSMFGNAYCRKKDYGFAKTHYEEALESYNVPHLQDSLAAAVPHIGLGYVCYHTGDYTNAVAFYKRSCNIRCKILGADHPLTKQTGSYLAAAQNMLRSEVLTTRLQENQLL